MRKRTRNRILISLTAVILLSAMVLLTGFSVKMIAKDNVFACNEISEGSLEVTAKDPLEKFAQENGLELSEWPDELIKLMNKNPETKDFVLNYPLLKDTAQEINLEDCDYTSSVPLFIQWDKRWGYTPYGDDMIATAGCGPTCLSMVCVHLLGDTTYNPQYMASFSEENGYCVPGNGTAWTLMSEGAQLLGLYSEEVPLDEGCIIEKLEAGSPIICIMGEGDFTSEGHYIVMTDYVDGQIKVNDPNSIKRSEKLWNYEDIKDQICNMWAYSVPFEEF